MNEMKKVWRDLTFHDIAAKPNLMFTRKEMIETMKKEQIMKM